VATLTPTHDAVLAVLDWLPEDAEPTADLVADLLRIALVGSESIWLTEVEHDKYAGRVVAKVATQDGADVSEALVAKGVAKRWDGRGPKPDWCGPADDGPPR
jgi:hypothetical protein